MRPINLSARPPAHRGRSYRPTGRGHSVAPFFASATLFLLVAAGLEVARTANVPVLPDLAGWRWPVIHLVFVGGATQLIIGSMTFFGVTLLMTAPPPGWLMRAQWVLVNAGALGLAGGALTGRTGLSVAGGFAVLGAVALTLVTLRLLRRRSLVRPDATILYYETALGFLLVGATLGILMLTGLSDSFATGLPRSHVRLAHLHLNLVGWITLTIIGTMRLFFGSVLGVPAGRPNPPWAEYAPLAGGTALIVLGWLVGSPAIVGIGTLIQAIGVLVYSASIVRQWRAHAGPLSLAAGHLLAATFWLVAMTVGGLIAGGLLVAGVTAAGAWVGAVAATGFVGFIGQTILGAWTHLFAVTAALPAGPLPPLAEPLRPRLRAVLHGQREVQLTLANLGAGAVILSQWLAPTAPELASSLTRVGLVALATVLAMVAVKAGRVAWLVLAARRTPAGPVPAAPGR
ncbi:MAG: hypothetical protein HYY04_13540 [Chloroflexi bacterium]|nr:hypothetical protein [Chloroflexota bacterium]